MKRHLNRAIKAKYHGAMMCVSTSAADSSTDIICLAQKPDRVNIKIECINTYKMILRGNVQNRSIKKRCKEISKDLEYNPSVISPMSPGDVLITLFLPSRIDFLTGVGRCNLTSATGDTFARLNKTV